MPQFDLQALWASLSSFLYPAIIIYLFHTLISLRHHSQVLKMRAKIGAFAEIIKQRINKSDLYNQVLKVIRRK